MRGFAVNWTTQRESYLRWTSSVSAPSALSFAHASSFSSSTLLSFDALATLPPRAILAHPQKDHCKAGDPRSCAALATPPRRLVAMTADSATRSRDSRRASFRLRSCLQRTSAPRTSASKDLISEECSSCQRARCHRETGREAGASREVHICNCRRGPL